MFIWCSCVQNTGCTESYKKLFLLCFVSTSSMSVSLTVQCSNTVSKLLYTPVNYSSYDTCVFLFGFLPADVAGSSQPCPSWRVRVWEHNNSLWPHSDTLKGGRVWRGLCSGGWCSGACRPGWVGCVNVCVYIIYLRTCSVSV